jgi:hypothetical protein
VNVGPSIDELSLPQRFCVGVGTLCRMVAAAGGKDRSLEPFVRILWRQLYAVARDFVATAARFKAGLLPPPRPYRPHTPAAGAGAAAPAEPAPVPGPESPVAARPVVLPREFGWLVRRLGHHAAGCGAQLNHLLTTYPEMAEILAAAPKLARQIRSLCWMLGVKLGPELLPPRPRKPRSVATARDFDEDHAATPADAATLADCASRAGAARRAGRAGGASRLRLPRGIARPVPPARIVRSGWPVPAEPILGVNYVPLPMQNFVIST